MSTATATPTTTNLDEFCDLMLQAKSEDDARKVLEEIAGRLLHTVNDLRSAETIDVDGDGVPLSRQLFSVGHLCQTLQIGPSAVRQLMRELGQRPAESRNEVLWYDGHALAAALRHRRETAE